MKALVKSSYLELVIAGLFAILLLLPKLVALYILIIAIVVGVSYYRKEIRFQLSKMPLLFVALYLAYIIGIFWTQDTALAQFYIVNKISFLLLPFLLAFIKKDGFNVRIIYWGLILACLLSFANGIRMGIPSYLIHHSFRYSFMSSHLSSIIHPTYVAVFTQFAFVVALMMYIQKKMRPFWVIVLLLVLGMYILMLMSLSGILFFGLVLFGVFIYMMQKMFSKLVIVLVSLFLFISGVFAVFHTPFLKDDLGSALKSFKQYSESPKKYIQNLPQELTGSEVRLIMWTVSCQEIANHPMGIGTGNIDLYLGNHLRSIDRDELATHNYNPHNQFFHTTLEIGIIGGLILVLIILSGFYLAKKYQSWTLFILFANLAVNCLFESMLQNQAGIIFYPFMLMIFIVDIKSQKKPGLW